MNIPIVTSEFEKFDFSDYEKRKDGKSPLLPDGTYIQYERESQRYFMIIQLKDSYFMVLKRFFANGNIEMKGVMINSGEARIGIWYTYNADGKLISQENMDQSFRFSFEKLFDLLKKEGIKLTMGHFNGGFHTRIDKAVDKDGPRWVVQWLKDTSVMPNIIEDLTIDGRSGKILKREKVKYFNN
ncbi:MAG TPA: hypothetical protein VNW04_07965 [Puia sp.]|nr:hypothetical protein [Puia sp.]